LNYNPSVKIKRLLLKDGQTEKHLSKVSDSDEQSEEALSKQMMTVSNQKRARAKKRWRWAIRRDPEQTNDDDEQTYLSKKLTRSSFIP